jgi:hypothetical protein
MLSNKFNQIFQPNEELDSGEERATVCSVFLAEEGLYAASEASIYRIMRQEGLLNYRGRTCSPREPRITHARGNAHPSSAGLGHNPAAEPCQGSVLLSIYGD